MASRATLWRCAVAFAVEQRAIAAVEFALVVPLLLALMSGGYEVSRVVDANRRLTSLAVAASTMLATNSTGSVSYLDLHYAADSSMLIFPSVLSDSYGKGIAWNQDISISMAGVSFTAVPPTCTSSCTYTANIVWTGGAAQRVCGTNPLPATSDTAAPTPTTLPPSLFTPFAMPSGTIAPLFDVVVDVSYSWTPLVFSKIIGPITLKRSAYITPRYVSQVTYSVIANDDKFGKECPGF